MPLLVGFCGKPGLGGKSQTFLVNSSLKAVVVSVSKPQWVHCWIFDLFSLQIYSFCLRKGCCCSMSKHFSSVAACSSLQCKLISVARKQFISRQFQAVMDRKFSFAISHLARAFTVTKLVNPSTDSVQSNKFQENADKIA